MFRCDLNCGNSIERNKCTGCRGNNGSCSRPHSCGCIGPTGPEGAPGTTILGSYESLEDLRREHPRGKPGDGYLVDGNLYVWDEERRRWKNVGNLRGPEGRPGATILGSYESIEALRRAHPTGEAGDAYLVNGSLYVWDETSSDWRNVGDLRGPEGPTGPAGEAATISGYYDDYDEFIQEHGTGTEGEMYIVEGILYIWDEENQTWRALGNLVGPTGPAGEAATISGYYDDYNEFIQEHGTGTEGEMYIVEGILYIWDEENQTWRALGNLVGPTGPAGEAATISGYYDDYNEFIQEHGTGTEGEMYIVEGILYIWDEGNQEWRVLGSLIGPTGPAGSAGDPASSFTMIPFASQQAPYVGTNNGGEPVNVALLGYGYLEYSTGGTANVAIGIDQNDKSFNLTSTANRQVAFSLPYDVTIESIYITVGNWGEFTFPPANTLVYPYVHIYAAEAGTNNFFPLDDAFAMPEVGINPAVAVAATMRSASKTGLNINLQAGTRIAICGMMQITGDTEGRNYYLYFTGGLGMRIRSAD